jgi:EmrB/QacA subfamily drug resistance transporter
MPQEHTSASTSTGTPKLVIGSVALLLLLAALDQTIVATALPTIVAEFGALEKMSWVVTAYILASTVSAPLYGKLGDLYGRRLMVYFSVGLFLAGSLLCSLAFSMDALIYARAVQGLGGGGLFVLALAVIGDVIPPRERGKIQGVFAAIFSTSSIIGPLLGGWFVQNLSWHWIFIINVPFGILAVVGFTMGFAPRGDRVKHAIDWLGAVTLTLALASLTLFSSLGAHGVSWSSAMALGLLATAIVSTGIFIWAEQRAAEPILPLHLFRENLFTTTSIISFVAGAVMLGSITFLPIYLQIALGQSPTTSGLMLVPLTLGIIASSTFAGQFMSRTGRYKILPILGLAMVALGAGAMTRLSLETTTLGFGLSLATVGLGMGCVFPVITTALQNAIPREHMGTATASGVMFRQVGGSIAVAVFGTIFALGMGPALPPGITINVSELGPMTMAALPPGVQTQVAQAVVTALSPIYYIVIAVSLGGLIVALMMREIRLNTRYD